MAELPRWIFKSEPSKYSFDDLLREGATVWDGITNALALQNLRKVRRGDGIFFYYTEGVRELVGIAEAVCDPYADPKLKDPKRAVVEIRAVRRLPRRIPLKELRAEKCFAGSDLLRLGRLSVVPLTADQAEAVLRIAAAGREA